MVHWDAKHDGDVNEMGASEQSGMNELTDDELECVSGGQPVTTSLMTRCANGQHIKEVVIE